MSPLIAVNASAPFAASAYTGLISQIRTDDYLLSAGFILVDEVRHMTVWRRVLVPSDLGLDRLHLVLNEAMGWTNSHLHQFLFGKRTFADPDFDEEGDFEDERGVSLDGLVGVGDRFTYEYDFGDDWMHEVKVEKKVPFDERFVYPVVIGGARACPPEDCGGVSGYDRYVEFLRTGKDPFGDDPADLREWLGRWKPDTFPLAKVKKAFDM